MKRPFYGYGTRPNYPAIAALCFGLAFGVVVWCAIFQAVRGLFN
jgi:hypothetical protein